MNLNEQTYRIKQMMGLTESVSSIKGILSVGSKGPEVEELQKTLKMYTDGKFGSQTKSCVEDFQTKMQIKSDGVVGTTTKEYLEKLESGSVKWETPEFCKTKQQSTQSTPQATTSQSPSEKSSSNNKGNYEAVLVGGLEHRSSDKPLPEQIKLLSQGLGIEETKIKDFHHYNSTSDVVNFIQSNPGIKVFLFSKGCEKAGEISTIKNLDKEKIYIIEPYAPDGKNAPVSMAINNGVPKTNVFYGPDRYPNLPSGAFGKGIGGSPSNGPTHFDSLRTVGQQIT